MYRPVSIRGTAAGVVKFCLLRVYRLVQQIVHDIAGFGESLPDCVSVHVYHLGLSMRGQVNQNTGNYYCSVKPKLRRLAMESRQFSLTLPQVWRLTLVPMKASISRRASSPIFLSMAPFLPMMMPLWESRSQ